MKHIASIACALVVLAFSIVVAAEVPVQVAPGGAAKATIVPAQDGYGFVWWDFRDAGSPGRPEGGLRFVPLDAAGHPSGAEVPLEIHDRYELAQYYRNLSQAHLERVPDGFVLFAGVGGYEVDTLSLDRAGRPARDSNPLLFRTELYPFSVASGPAAMVMTYPEWYGTFQNWSQVVDDRGFAKGMRFPLALPRSGAGEELGDLDSQVARDGERFVAVWNQYPIGIRLRELSPAGVPDGQPTLVHPDLCTANVSVATTSRGQAIAYSEGCGQADVFLLLRDRKGALTGPITLTAEPYDEGVDPGLDTRRPLRIVSAGDRFGVLYAAAAIPVPPYSARWFFAEFDASGRPIGSKRELNIEFSLDTNDEVELIFDARTDRYVLAWGGAGPQGWGAYVLALSPRR